MAFDNNLNNSFLVITDINLDIDYKRKFIEGIYTMYQVLEADTHINCRKNLSRMLDHPACILFFEDVLNLFTVCKFKNFSLIFKDFLRYFYTLFLISLRNFENNLAFHIINCLGTIVKNAYEQNMMPLEDIQKLSDTVEHLCKILLNLLPSSLQAQVTVLLFYKKLIKIAEVMPEVDIELVPPSIRHLLLINAGAITWKMYADLIHESQKLANKRNYDQNHCAVRDLREQVQDMYDLLFENPLNTNLFNDQVVKTNVNHKRMLQLPGFKKMFRMKHNIAFQHITHLDSNGKMRDKPRFDIDRLAKFAPNLIRLLKPVKLSNMASSSTASSNLTRLK